MSSPRTSRSAINVFLLLEFSASAVLEPGVGIALKSLGAGFATRGERERWQTSRYVCLTGGHDNTEEILVWSRDVHAKP